MRKVSLLAASVLPLAALLGVALLPSRSAAGKRPAPNVTGHWTGTFQQKTGSRDSGPLSADFTQAGNSASFSGSLLIGTDPAPKAVTGTVTRSRNFKAQVTEGAAPPTRLKAKISKDVTRIKGTFHGRSGGSGKGKPIRGVFTLTKSAS